MWFILLWFEFHERRTHPVATSALPQFHVNRVELGLAFLTLLTIGNLRGIRESGRIFAVPTYFFVVSIFVLLLVGFYHYLTGTIMPVDAPLPADAVRSPLTTFLVLTAFANGCIGSASRPW